MSDTHFCNFCGKRQHEVRLLIAGPRVFICSECVDLCFEIAHPDKPPPAAERNAREEVDRIYRSLTSCRYRLESAELAIAAVRDEIEMHEREERQRRREERHRVGDVTSNAEARVETNIIGFGEKSPDLSEDENP
jgi:hypothetical protein